MLDYVDARVAARERKREAAEAASLLARLDWTLLAATVALAAYGLWVISGVTHDDVAGNPGYYVVRQAVFMAVGLVGFAAMILIDPALFRRYKRLLYVGTLGTIRHTARPRVRARSLPSQLRIQAALSRSVERRHHRSLGDDGGHQRRHIDGDSARGPCAGTAGPRNRYARGRRRTCTWTRRAGTGCSIWPGVRCWRGTRRA